MMELQKYLMLFRNMPVLYFDAFEHDGGFNLWWNLIILYNLNLS